MGRQKVRVSLVVVGAVLDRAYRHGNVDRNVARAVKKPTGRRQREITVPSPAAIEAARHALLAQDRLLDATLVSVLAYAGLRPRRRWSGATCASARC